MLLVGLTGGIGSGKSTVARMLEERGAVVLDADDFARRAVEPGSPGFELLVEHFGRDVVGPEGRVDRDAVARLVFGDRGARLALEAIVHPEVLRLFLEAVEPFRGTDRIVVYVVPLLAERRLEGMFDLVITVSANEQVRMERLGSDRGMDPAHAAARLRAQARDRDREEVADVVVVNEGSIEDLRDRVGRVWSEVARRDMSQGDAEGRQPSGPRGP